MLEEHVTLKEVLERPWWWWYRLTKLLADERVISVKIHYPLTTPTGRKKETGEGFADIPWELIFEAGRPAVRVNMRATAELVKSARIRPSWPCRISVHYPT
jgi:hypothetical protein